MRSDIRIYIFKRLANQAIGSAQRNPNKKLGSAKDAEQDTLKFEVVFTELNYR
jgi:hypothetical protein